MNTIDVSIAGKEVIIGIPFFNDPFDAIEISIKNAEKGDGMLIAYKIISDSPKEKATRLRMKKVGEKNDLEDYSWDDEFMR